MVETISNNGALIGEDLTEVDFAQSFQEAALSSSVMTFEKEELREKLMGADKKQLLVITSTINSPKVIKSVDSYNEELLMSVL